MKRKLLLLGLVLGILFSGICVNAQNSTGDAIKESERKDVSELMLRKTFNGQSLEATKKFSVETYYSKLKLIIQGEVNSGSIIITFISPTGKEFKTITVDNTFDVYFNQELNLKSNPSEWIGEWKLKIKTEKADGSYSVQIHLR
ncbi:hypothetical protein ACE01N_04335 [Saccharicrinis sp. FJH2]|uniref:hypothetical protein n=1 Tax=Saccharicrinis sp. FJH65 TaxID=3344659 RepID=UPI0035F4BA4A